MTARSPIIKDKALLLLLNDIEDWISKYLDFGEESCNWQNGESEVFSGSSDQNLVPLRRRLQKALGKQRRAFVLPPKKAAR